MSYSENGGTPFNMNVVPAPVCEQWLERLW